MKRVQHEANEQAAVFRWAAWARGQWKELDLLYHIPNGGSRHPYEAANLKRQGVKAGVPDLCLPSPHGDFHGLYIEMKAGTNKPTCKADGLSGYRNKDIAPSFATVGNRRLKY